MGHSDQIQICTMVNRWQNRMIYGLLQLIGVMLVNNSNNQKSITLVVIALAIILSTILLPYIAVFGKYGLSDKHQAWANFGGYIGGVLGPIFSCLAFIYIIKTFKIQKAQQDDAEIKIQLVEISETIRFFLKKADETLSEKVHLDGEGAMSIRTALSAVYSLKNSDISNFDKNTLKKTVKQAVTDDQIFTLLNTLSVLCDLYDEFTKLGGSRIILSAYINSHLESVLGLHEIDQGNKRIPETLKYYRNYE